MMIWCWRWHWLAGWRRGRGTGLGRRGCRGSEGSGWCGTASHPAGKEERVMSIRSFLGRRVAELRLPRLDSPRPGGKGAVIEGTLSVEEAQAAAVRRSYQGGEAYESVGDYDPVLRSHTRLDRE